MTRTSCSSNPQSTQNHQRRSWNIIKNSTDTLQKMTSLLHTRDQTVFALSKCYTVSICTRAGLRNHCHFAVRSTGVVFNLSIPPGIVVCPLDWHQRRDISILVYQTNSHQKIIRRSFVRRRWIIYPENNNMDSGERIDFGSFCKGQEVES